METNKRGWIKNAIIIFLVMMLILTLFSNTFMNRSLPEVAVQNAESGSITTQVKLSGSVNANTTKAVTLEYARKIDTVLVRRGDTVEPGTVLATLVKGESDEIDQLEIELKQLQIEYKKLQIESEDSLTAKRYELEDAQRELVEVNDYIASYPTLNAQKTAYEDQIKLYKETIKTREAEIAAKEDEIAELDEVIADIEKQMAKLSDAGLTLEKLSKAITDAEDELKDAERARKSAKRASDSAQSVVDNVNTLYSAVLRDYNAACEATKNAQKTLDSLNATLKTLEAERDALYEVPVEDRDEQWTADYNQNRDKINGTKSQISDAETALTAAKAKEAELLKEYTAKGTELSTANSTYESARAKYESCLAAEKSAQKTLDSLNEGWSRAMLEEQRDARQEERDALEKERKLMDKDREKMNTAVADLEKELADYVAENITTTLDDAEDKQRTLTRSVESLTEQVRIAEANGSIDDETAALNLQIKRSEMQKKQREIEKLREKAVTTELKSTVNGTVSTVSIAAGDEVAAGTTVMEITASDGFTMECSVTNAQAARLRVGQIAEVQYYYWGDKPNVYISTIKNDPNNSGKGKLVTFTVEGDIADGTSLTVTVGGQGSSYDCIVPNSAIREDSDGKFILVVTSKSSPLGNRYYASRQNVTVLASDATRSAIDATLSWGDYVITGASVPISDGMQVRMSEQ